MKKIVRTIILMLSAILLAAGCSNTAGPKETTAGSKQSADSNSKQTVEKPKEKVKIKVGYDGFSMTTTPINYTKEKGIFDKYGLDVQLIYIKAGTTLTQAMIAGDIDIAQNGYTPAVNAIVQGADLVFVGGISHKLPFQMVTKSDITSAEQLKGKKIAISKFGSSTDQAAELALTSLGLKRGDATILQVGGAPERIAALKSGQVDASMEQYPQTGDLLKSGFRVMVDVTDKAGEYPNTAYVTKKSFIKGKEDAMKKFFMALTEGIHEYKKNKDEALKSTAKFLSIKDPGEISDTYDFYSQKVFPDIPKPSEKGLELVLAEAAKENPKAKEIKVDQIIELSIFDQLEKEGFYNQFKK